ncbi:MAG: hypothetical protein JNM90_09325 [Burkholderiales bacterium]|nr:hypothetical protein [Burkholderiales bacterium]
MTSLAFASLRWASAPMPGASGPVDLARLPDLADGGFRAFVRFPPGWERHATGHYQAAEEFLVLAGSLTLEGRAYGPGAYGWIAAHRTRRAMSSAPGCLVHAWFGGLPLWRRGDAPVAATGDDRALSHWREAPRRERGGGTALRELHAGPGHRTWLVEGDAAPLPDPARADCEWLDLDDFTWCWNAAPRRGGGARLLRLTGAAARRGVDDQPATLETCR